MYIMNKNILRGVKWNKNILEGTNWNKILFGAMFALISLILLSITSPTTMALITCPKNINYTMGDIYVPPAQYSHLYNICTKSNYWRNIQSDNNTPGILPGATLGEDLGLSDNPVLSLHTPIISPLTNYYFTQKNIMLNKNCSQIEGAMGDSCSKCKA